MWMRRRSREPRVRPPFAPASMHLNCYLSIFFHFLETFIFFSTHLYFAISQFVVLFHNSAHTHKRRQKNAHPTSYTVTFCSASSDDGMSMNLWWLYLSWFFVNFETELVNSILLKTGLFSEAGGPLTIKTRVLMFGCLKREDQLKLPVEVKNHSEKAIIVKLIIEPETNVFDVSATASIP